MDNLYFYMAEATEEKSFFPLLFFPSFLTFMCVDGWSTSLVMAISHSLNSRKEVELCWNRLVGYHSPDTPDWIQTVRARYNRGKRLPGLTFSRLNWLIRDNNFSWSLILGLGIWILEGDRADRKSVFNSTALDNILIIDYNKLLSFVQSQSIIELNFNSDFSQFR